MNVVTENLMRAPLREICPASKDRIHPSECSGKPYLGLEHIEKDTGKLIGQGNAQDVKSTKSVFHQGDLLYGKLRPYLNKVWVAEFDGICSTDILVFPGNDFVDSRFLKYRFLCRDFVSYANANSSGVNLPRVNLNALGQFEIDLPPLPEQRRIVARIEELFSRLDAGVSALHHAKAQLQRYRQSVLNAAVTGELTKEWREQHPDTEPVEYERITNARQLEFESGGTNPRELKDFVQADQPFELPISWRWFRAEQLCDLITKGTTPKKDKMSEGGEIPYIKVYNLTFDGRLDFGINPTFIPREVHEKELKRSIVCPGNVLMNIVGPPLGKVSIVPATHPEWNINQAIAVFKPICGVLSNYLAIVLREKSLLEINKRKAKATAGQFNLTLAICRDSAVPVPPITEQHQIVAEVEARTTVIDNLEAELDRQITRSNRLRQSTLASAFSGTLTL